MRAPYPTLYEAHVAAGATPVPCIDCGDGGRLTVHPLRLCRQHFLDRYGLDASSRSGRGHMADLLTWDSARPKHGFRPWKLKLPIPTSEEVADVVV